MQRVAIAFLAVIAAIVATPALGGSSPTLFTFETPPIPPEGFAPLPATFSQDGVVLHAASVLGRIQHTDEFSSLFSNTLGGALEDPFRLTQLPGYPPETLILDFKESLKKSLARA